MSRAGQRRLRPAARRGGRWPSALPAHLARRLRARGRARGGARRDPRRRRSSPRPTTGRACRCAAPSAAAAVRMRSYPGGSRQLADGWTKNFASGASARPPAPVRRAVAVGQRPPRGRRRRGSALVDGADRVGRVPDLRAAPRCGRSPGSSSRASCAAILRRVGLVPLVDLGAVPGCPCSPSTSSSRARSPLTVVRRSVRWRGRDVDVRGRASREEVALMLRLLMPQALTVVVDVVAWGVFHAGTGYAAHRLGDSRLGRDGWLLRPRRFEAGGRWYRRRLRIHRWKDRLPEAGALFRGRGQQARSCRRTTSPGSSSSSGRPVAPSWRHWWAHGLRPAVRPVEPAARRPGCWSPTACASTCRSSRSSATTGSGPRRYSVAASQPMTRALERPAGRDRAPMRGDVADAARPDRPAADLLVAAQRDPGRLRRGGWISAPLDDGRRRVDQPARARASTSPAPARVDERLFGAVPTVWLQQRLVDGTAALVRRGRRARLRHPLRHHPARSPRLVWFCLRDRFAAWLVAVLDDVRSWASPGTSSTPPHHRGWPPSGGDIGSVDRISDLGWDVLHLDVVGRLTRARPGRQQPRGRDAVAARGRGPAGGPVPLAVGRRRGPRRAARPTPWRWP